MVRAAVLIGVAKADKPKEPETLEDAVGGVLRMKDWALANGFAEEYIRVFTNLPVRIAAIQEAILALVDSGTVEQLLVYFAGYGVNIGYSEYWLLSGAPMDSGVRERGVLNWGWVQTLLEVVDQRVPLASGASVPLFTHDVYRYLRDAKIRKTMNDGVRGAFTPGRESIVVSHSLGTVVAYDVLHAKDVSPQNVPLFMTLGSPLCVKVVRKSLQPVGHPAGVGSWFNAMDERDVVALFPLRAPHFGIVPAIINKTDVDNPTANQPARHFTLPERPRGSAAHP